MRPWLQRVVASLTVAVVCAGGAWSADAEATMIRCQDAAGRITYQNTTCPDGARGVPIDPYTSSGARFATRQEINRALKPAPAEKNRPAKTAADTHRGKPRRTGD